MHDKNNYFIISEYVKYGQLFEYILIKKDSITETDAQNIIKQLFLALNYMHSNNIAHRDIKPENILISNKETLEIKLTDFGFATYHKQTDLDDVLGSPIYMAPEIVKRLTYNEKVDCWSAGVVTFVLLTGLPPFNGNSKEEVYNSIMNIEPDFDIPELS